MRAVLISIKPKWCEQIASGEKTIEVRKTRPKIETPFKCYIYCTSGGYQTPKRRKSNGQFWIGKPINDVSHGRYLGNGTVVGEFVCDRIEEFHDWQLSPGGQFRDSEEDELKSFLEKACISYEEVCKYRANLPYYKPLSELRFYNSVKGRWNKDGSRDMVVRKPPQSWCYVEEVYG